MSLLSGPQPARRRRGRRGRTARIAVPAAAVAALGVAAGLFVATSSGGPAAMHRVAATASASQGVSSSAVITDCDIIVPAHPLTAKGLATPYQLTGDAGASAAATGCQMINSLNLGAFVQATILDPRTGALSVYDPLVVTKGTKPAVRPVVPHLPADAIVTIDMGFNGTILRQVGATAGALREGKCTDGEPGSPFGQVSFCNGPEFFRAAYRAEHEGLLKIPAVGTSRTIVPSAGALGTGRQCPTVRNYDMVDQDPSDNVTTAYLLDPVTGRTAQDNAANRARMGTSAKVLVNGSDNALIDDFLDPALGCQTFEAPDLANHGVLTTSQALDELLANRNQPRQAALVPENDEMVVDNAGAIDVAKTDLYRSEIGQAPVSGKTEQTSSPLMFCQDLVNIQTPFVAANQTLLAKWPSPVPTTGDTLYTFLASRLGSSFDNLACQNFGLANPVAIVTDGAGAATQATLNTATQEASF